MPDITFFKNFTSNVNQHGTNRKNLNFFEISRKLQDDTETRNSLLNFTKDLDLGLFEFQFRKAKVVNENDPHSPHEVPILDGIYIV